ncbi:MAG: carboxylesterase family protein [Dehalococcoidia bacterium]|nr:MAG: carboxylesterase family protein [Dehalococcoidia bacterium]
MNKLISVLTILLTLSLLMVLTGCAGETTNQSFTLSTWTGDETVQTLYGQVQAFEDAGDTWVWKAIPYARPPVDELRWKAPLEPDPWNEVLMETEYCSECTQLDLGGDVVGSEDCLYLNIWRPQSEEKDLPVYFWIHGGGNSIGTASDDMYNGANIAGTSNMVVVTVNYRLGPLGWLTHSALRSGGPNSEIDNSGNYGTLDLIRALTWVQRNIEAFGGDPSNVTIAGESAGAINVFSLLISPLAQHLFHKGVAQSGIPISSSLTDGEESTEAVLPKLLVNDGTAVGQTAALAHLEGMTEAEIESYLRSKTGAELLGGYEQSGFSMLTFPFIFEDGTVIPDTGYDILETGTYPNKVPLIIGSNKEETKLFLFMEPSLADDDETYQSVASFTSDLWKAMGVDGVARKLRSHSDQPDVYVYQFLWGAEGDSGESVIPDPWGFRIGASHGLDIPFFFGGDDFFGPLSSMIFTEENRPGREALSDAIMAYVASFARTGDPNAPGSGLPEWKHWSNEADAPKLILWDANNVDIDISMSTMELTTSSVKAEIDPSVLEELDSSALRFMLEFIEHNESQEWLEELLR